MGAINVRGGIRVAVPDSIRRMAPYILFEQQDWFEDEIGFVRSLCHPRVQAIDIEADYGLYALDIAGRIMWDGKV